MGVGNSTLQFKPATQCFGVPIYMTSSFHSQGQTAMEILPGWKMEQGPLLLLPWELHEQMSIIEAL